MSNNHSSLLPTNSRRRPRHATRYRTSAFYRARAAHRARTAAHRAAAHHAHTAAQRTAATDPAVAEASQHAERMHRQLRERQAARLSAAVQNVMATMDAANAAISDASAAVEAAALQAQAAPFDAAYGAALYLAALNASNVVEAVCGAAAAGDLAISIARDIRSMLDTGQRVGPELQRLDNAVDQAVRRTKTARAAVDDIEDAANTGTSEAGFSSLPPSPTPSDDLSL